MSTNKPSAPEKATSAASNTETTDTLTTTTPQATPAIETTNDLETQPSALFGGWFSSIVQSAKDTVSKSAGTLENIKRDLSEFKDAVQNDATTMVYSTASIVKNKLNEIGSTVNEIGSLGTDTIDDEIAEQSSNEAKKEEASKQLNPTEQTESTSNLDKDETKSSEQLPFNLETINSWTNILTDRAKSTINMVKETLVDSIFINRDFLIDELDEEPYVLKDGKIVPIKGWKEMLHSLQTSPDTYCREANGAPEEFDLWLTKFNLFNYQKQMEYLIENVPEIRKLHENLVPKEMSDSDFWHRYYYKVYQLKEVQKQLVLASESSPPSADSTVDKSSVNIKYLSESNSTGSESKVSRSSTEDWEKMTDVEQNVKKDQTDKSSSDEERDWVKCD